jgi:hypothetical protein
MNPATLLPLLLPDLLLEPRTTCPNTPCSRHEPPAVHPLHPHLQHLINPADLHLELPKPQPPPDREDVPGIGDRAVTPLAVLSRLPELLPEPREPRVHRRTRQPRRGNGGGGGGGSGSGSGGSSFLRASHVNLHHCDHEILPLPAEDRLQPNPDTTPPVLTFSPCSRREPRRPAPLS